MAIRPELSLRLANSPGALRDFCDTLAAGHVNLLAMYLDSGGRVRCVVDNPLLAAESLKAREFNVEQRDVLYITLPNNPGAMAGAARLLDEAGVNVEYAYAGAVEGTSMAVVVFGVADARRAATAAGV